MARKKKPIRKPGPRPGGAVQAPSRPAAPAARGVEDLLRGGREAFEAGDWLRAARDWQEANRLRPDERLRAAAAEARFRAGLAEADTGEQVTLLSQAATLVPERHVYHYHLGLAYLRRGDGGRAAAALRAALELAPDDERTRFHLALALLRQGTPEALAAARGLMPPRSAADSHWACLRLIAYLREGNADAAYGVAARAPGAGPVALDIRLAGSLIDLAEGTGDGGAKALAEVARKGKNTPPGAVAAYALGILASSEGDAAAAETWWSQAAAGGYDVPELTVLRLQALHRTAYEAAQAGRVPDAARAWEEILTIRPGDAVAQRNLRRSALARGDALARAGDIAGAAAAWEAALAADPSNLDLRQNLALAYERLDRDEDAIAEWRRLLDAWRKDVKRAAADPVTSRRMARAYHHLGYLIGDTGDFSTAIRELRNALRFDPGSVATRLLLADSYLLEEQYGQARSELEKVLQQEPDNTQALAAKAHLAWRREDWDEAEAAARAALEREPKQERARQVMMRVLRQRSEEAWEDDDYDALDELIQERVELLPGDAEPYLHRGCFALRDNEKAKATAAFKKALAAEDTVTTLLSIAGEYLNHDLQKDAMKWFDRALEREPTAETRMEIVELLSDAGVRWSVMRRFAEAAASAADTDASALAILAHHATMAGQFSSAMQWASRAAQLAPGNAHVLVSLAMVQRTMADPRARETFDAAERAARAAGDRQLVETIREMRTMPAEVARLLAEMAPKLRGGMGTH